MKAYRTLKVGDAGLAVALWQKFLISKNFLARVDDQDYHHIGIFDSSTEEATQRYQKDRGLGVDGVVGRETHAKASKEGFDGIEVEQATALGAYRWYQVPIDRSFKLIVSEEISLTIPGQPERDVKAVLAFLKGEGFAG